MLPSICNIFLRCVSGGCIALLVITLAGCHEILEDDLSNASITLISPPDSGTTTLFPLYFSWEPLKEPQAALRYQLQIASPSFDSLWHLWLDTSITEASFSFGLPPGHYQWRVRTVNGSSQSGYTTYLVKVDSTENLSANAVVLRQPVSGHRTNEVRPTFSWESLQGADQYSLVVVRDDFVSGDLFTSEIIMPNTSTSLPLDLEEGVYEWGVRGENTLSQTVYSVRELWVDTTAPAIPQLLEPLHQSTINDSTIVFSWQRAADSGTPVLDSVIVFSDANQVDREMTGSGNGSLVLPSPASGTWYWIVKATDEAGNYATSNLFEFTVL